MAVPSTFGPVKPQDFTLNPIRVYQPFVIDSELLQVTESGYNLVQGLYSGRITPIAAPESKNDPINLDGSYKHIIWKHIDHLYYRYPYRPGSSLEHTNPRYVEKFLNVSASYLSIPYLDYGERIKKKSVLIQNSTYNLEAHDDGEGNLFDPQLELEMPKIERHNTISYWGFNNTFRLFKNTEGLSRNSKYEYVSNTFSGQNSPSIVYNTYFEPGPEINSVKTGMCATFQKNGEAYGYIMTPNNNAYNFDNYDDFTISFWIYPTKQESASVISKNGVVFQNQLGKLPKTNSYGITWAQNHISSSYINSDTDVYPFDVSWSYSTGSIGNLNFKRSDGSNISLVSLPVTVEEWSHISIVRYNSHVLDRFGNPIGQIKMYVNGNESTESISDTTMNPINQHSVMFGAKNMLGLNAFSGSIDEIRLVNRAYYINGEIDDNFYEKLADPKYMYNTSVIGNVFYRSGNIVESSLYPKYRDLFRDNFVLKYKGTHTIYQYEVLCRIRKGDFNSTLNPTALRSPKSDKFIEKFIRDIKDESGNIIPNSKVKPYATSIGLYNDRGELVAIGKMGQPIQMRDDVDINIAVRWDG